MLITNRTFQAWFFLSCSFFLTHCTRMGLDSHLNQQKSTIPYTLSTAAYLAMAKNQTGSERQALKLMAAGRAIYDGQWHQGLAILQQAGPMPAELADEKNILLAKIDIIRNQPKSAIAKLAVIKQPNRLPPFYQTQYHSILAYAFQAKGAWVEAAVERIKLDFLLQEPLAKTNNRRALWLSLTKLPQADLDTLMAESVENSYLQGWLALANLSRKTYHHPDFIINDLLSWQRVYRNHPANALLPKSLDTVKTHLFSSPKHIALLLPLTGPLSGPGKAIEDGFMAAYQSSDRFGSISIKVYDTYSSDVNKLYQKALKDGADYVVGPLSKADATQIAKLPHPVTTLLLNETSKISDNKAFQFGLSPTHEARQVATKAHKSGYSRALVIAPAGEWGTEILTAFKDEWTHYHDQIVEIWQYAPGADLASGVRQLLRASESAARFRPTKMTPTLESSTKRRQDFDVIILVAYPSIARQIMPLLRYYFASDVPIFATSSVYSGIENTSKDRDLNGVIFCDMPWVFSHQLGQQHHWPEQLNSYNRLYALGMDSFALSNQLNQLLLFPAIGLNDHSGVIYLSKNQKLSRILAFGQFRKGLPHLLS